MLDWGRIHQIESNFSERKDFGDGSRCLRTLSHTEREHKENRTESISDIVKKDRRGVEKMLEGTVVLAVIVPPRRVDALHEKEERGKQTPPKAVLREVGGRMGGNGRGIRGKKVPRRGERLKPRNKRKWICSRTPRSRTLPGRGGIRRGSL